MATKKILIGKTYRFSELEEILSKWDNRAICFVVFDVENNQKAFMHTFGQNFCGDWKSGDGILFYDDAEQHTAHSTSKFILLNAIDLSLS